VLANYVKNWEADARHWALFGRPGLWEMDVNTNNHLERFFGLLKYNFLQKRKMPQLAQLVCVLLTDVMPYYIRGRLKKLSGLQSSGDD
jgi:hypothetical protein